MYLHLYNSPGYLKDDFMAYYDTECVLLGTEGVEMMRQKPRYIKAHTSSGHRRAVDELLGNPELSGQLGHVKAAEEVKILQKFHDTLAADPDRACYGPPDVMYADTQLAIENLLVTDSLFRSSDILIRRKYVALTESVIEHGGRVHVFSTLHVSGEQLTMYSGVAAILRYPLVIPEDLPLVSDSVASDTLASSLRKMNV